MQKMICLIRDRLSESCGPVMLFTAIPAAVRSFSDVALDPNTMVGRHPEDFDLLHVASIDEGSGEVVPLSPPVVLLTGAAWSAMQQKGVAKPAERDDVQLSLLKKEA